MTEIIKDIMKFVAEIALLLFLLYVLFGGSGVATMTIDFAEMAEPLVLQNEISRTITVASYIPGTFERVIETSGKKHRLEITQEDTIYYINIFPSKEGVVKTKYTGIEKVPIFTSCTLEPLSPADLTLQEDATSITITKTITDEGCKVVLT